MHDILFKPLSLGALELSNRIIMAPMTRDRAGPDDVPSDMMVEYYRQRATAGLIITEGVQPSLEGKGYWRTPGIFSQAQTDGWARVAEAVHAEGGKIVMQLMHCGRVVVPQNRGYKAEIVAPSAIACSDQVPGPEGVPTDCGQPRAMEQDDFDRVAKEYRQAAINARDAGIDGIELHCASGYLINQFLNPVSNHRTDKWGGDIENRVRFPIQILETLASTIGKERVGFRISPGNPYNAMGTDDPAETFVPFLKAANALDLAFVHIVDMGLDDLDSLAMIKANWSGPIITNNGLDASSGTKVLEAERADAISIGRAFISNPDLVTRMRCGAELAKPNYKLLYTGEDAGYIDYPEMT